MIVLRCNNCNSAKLGKVDNPNSGLDEFYCKECDSREIFLEMASYSEEVDLFD